MVCSEFLGFLAGTCSMLSLVPQVYKTWMTKSAKGVSIQMFIIYEVGVLLWMAYGIIDNKPAIYITNLIVFCLASIQIVLKIKYDR
jgi:MtN3 and saliva related transmembrane protein